jgi:hypothetical protein
MIWAQNVGYPEIEIEEDVYLDGIKIRNKKTQIMSFLPKYAIENLSNENAEKLIIEAIMNTMKDSNESLNDMNEKAAAQVSEGITSGVYTPGTVTYVGAGAKPIWVSNGSGGAGNGALGFGNYVRGALGAPYMHDMPELEAEYEQKEQQLQKDLLKTKLFTPDERTQLMEIKNKILIMFNRNRLAEEKAIPFNTNKMVIAGGCFASLINEEPINDIDVFFLDDEYNHNLAKGMAKSYESETPVVVHPYTPVVPVMSSANTVVGHISLSPKKNLNHHVKIGNKNYMDNDQIEQTIFFKHSKFQYITTKYKTREELINHFDFRHCCVSYDFATDKLYITREVYDLIKSKRLVQNGIRRPALWRYDKFYNRGWKEEIALVDDLNFL